MVTESHTYNFIEKCCAQNRHNKCNESWRGAGIQVKCTCSCHEMQQKGRAE